MNYLTEIKLFYDWLESHTLTPSAIALWHGLMYTANRGGWEDSMVLPISVIESRTQLSRSAIYRERKRLVEAGLLRYIEREGRQSTIYNICSFEKRVVCQIDTQSATQRDDEQSFVSQVVSQIDTQHATQNEGILLYNKTKLNIEKENNIKEKEVAEESAQISTDSKSKREKSSAQKEKTKRALFNHATWLETIDEPWRGIMLLWLEYKAARREAYKTEVGAKKCLTMLRNLSGGNADLAQRIIDQSMANNWAGLFALREGQSPGHPPNGRQYGQRTGQIIQSDDEAKRQRYIERLKNAGKNKQQNYGY